jgi:ATP-binding cassette subfamily B protein
MPDFPHYSQLDQMDCGPTCLRMIAKHYGKSYSLQSLRDKAQIGKEGVSLLGISEAAESIGFRTLGAKISFSKLVEEAPLPCIVHWQQNHFVVVHHIKRSNTWMSKLKGGFRRSGSVEKMHPDHAFDFLKESEIIIPPKIENENRAAIDKGIISVADPARGLVNYTSEEFCQHWLSSGSPGEREGVVLLLEPTPSFYAREDEKSNVYGFEKLLGYLWQYKALIVQLLLGLVVGSGLQLLFPFLTQSIVDVGINTPNLSFIYLILIAQLMLMGGRLSVEFIRSWILLLISSRVNLSILSDFLIKLMRLPVSFFNTRQFGDILQRVGDHQRIESFLTGQSLTVLFSLINLIIFSVVLAFYNLAIFGIFIVASIAYVGWIVLFLRQRRKLDFRTFDVSSRSQSAMVQLIQGMQEIKLAGAERPMRWAWEHLQARLYKLQIKGLALSQYQQGGSFAINEGKNIIITFLAAQAVVNGQLTLGGMLAVQFIIGQLNSPIEQFVTFVQSFQNAKISLERLNEIHTIADEEPADKVFSNDLPQLKDITLQNVFFQYSGAGNEPVLKNINMSIAEGKSTAIVGMSGSGKTTLLKILLRFFDPSKGEIKIGDLSLSDVSHALWRSKCGVVMQDGYIFSDSIARNIAVGVDKIDADRLDHAAYVANLRDFIDGLPSGYHTKIGLEGNGISEGQKQRILIARAVYKNPDYIFFDEATNSLDANNEAIIMERLNGFFKNRTVVVVAHRLSTVRHADQIVVMDKGVIAEAGTHEELVALRGAYWILVKNQLELGS